ncbi:MAG: hypothetical protein ABSG32_08195 [Terriglobia bacterium]|jgi:hypothetical protein
MRLNLWLFYALLGAMMVVACFTAAPPALSQPQEGLVDQLKARFSKTGVFFRADAPRSLRNPGDVYLPIFVEIINGVEQEAHTTGSGISSYVKRDPLKLQGVNVFVKPSGDRHQFGTEPLRLGASKDFSFDARAGSQPLVIPDRFKKNLEVPREAIQSFLASHYLGGPFASVDFWVSIRAVDWPDQDFYLRVKLNAAPLPQIANWYRGDIHYHSGYTDNPAERGYPLDVTKQAAIQAGMDWLLLTEHSTDLTPDRYKEELEDVQKFRDGRLMLIRGEEVTVASGQDKVLTTVHMVAAPSPDDPDKGFPDLNSADNSLIITGDGSVSYAAMPLKDALARIAAAGGFAYAAHPFDPISPVMRGGKWDLDADFLVPDGKHLQDGLVGLEPWNRATMATADDMRDPFCIRPHEDASDCFQPDPGADQYARLEQGIKEGWQPLLQRGLGPGSDGTHALLFKAFLAAGSDAHGDLNYEATMDVVDFLGKPSRGLNGYAEDNALGRISTVVFAPAGMGPRGENVLRALREGHTVGSNGPILVAGFDRNSNGSLDDPEDVGIGQEISCPLKSLPPLQLRWVSSEEFGPLQSIKLILGTSTGELPPVEVPVPSAKALASDGLVPFDLHQILKEGSQNWIYVRLVASARNSANNEFRCYTNPIWIKATGE